MEPGTKDAKEQVKPGTEDAKQMYRNLIIHLDGISHGFYDYFGY